MYNLYTLNTYFSALLSASISDVCSDTFTECVHHNVVGMFYNLSAVV